MSPRRPGQKRPITALHQGACFLDQPLCPPSFGRGFPFGAAADRQAGIDDPVRDLIRCDAGTIRSLQEIENGEHHAEAPRLIGGGQEAGRCRVRRAGEPSIQPRSHLMAQLRQSIAQDQAYEGYTGTVGAKPETMPSPVVDEDEVAAILQSAIDCDKARPRNLERFSRRASRRRHVEDVGIAANRRRP